MGKTIELSDELYDSLKDTLSAGGATEVQGWKDLEGEKLFIRTVTYHLVGKVVAVNGTLIELSDASWVASSGRFMQAIKDGTLDEVEPVGRAFVNAGAITDCFPWRHALPKTQK
jgi:hypothetical protein